MPAHVDRSGDEQVAKSAPHHWVEAPSQPLRDGREINNSAPDALKLSRPILNAPDTRPNTSRITTVIYSQHRPPTADSPRHKTQKEHYSPTEFNLQLLKKVARKGSGVAQNIANPRRRFKRRLAAARREGQPQTYNAYVRQALKPKAKTPK